MYIFVKQSSPPQKGRVAKYLRNTEDIENYNVCNVSGYCSLFLISHMFTSSVFNQASESLKPFGLCSREINSITFLVTGVGTGEEERTAGDQLKEWKHSLFAGVA